MRFSQLALLLGVLLSQHASANAQEQDEPAENPPSFGQFFSVWSNEPLARSSFSEDLTSISIFFDSIHLESSLEPINVEIMKQHVFLDTNGQNGIGSGWRIESVLDGWSFAAGDEVLGRKPLRTPRPSRTGPVWLNHMIENARFSTYGSLGLRLMHLEDSFHLELRSSFLGNVAVQTLIDHRVIGPQLGLGVVAEASFLRFEAVALGLVGYGDAEVNQRSEFHEGEIAGFLNRSANPLSTRNRPPTYHLDSYLALHGELRVGVGCQLTQSLRADARWLGLYTNELYSSFSATDLSYPEYGIVHPTSDDGYEDYLYLGLTYTQ